MHPEGTVERRWTRIMDATLAAQIVVDQERFDHAFEVSGEA